MINNLNIYLIVYILLINIITFILFGIDKYAAIKHIRRIREITLLGLSLIGGALGGLIAMYLFHHKTAKLLFKYGIPLLLITNTITIVFIMINVT